MSEIDGLLRKYSEFVALPWDASLAGPQKVWFAIYEPTLERRVRLRVGDFENETRRAGHGWSLVDLTDSFAQWMAGNEYREAYFAQPEDMALALEAFGDAVVAQLKEALATPEADESSVVAVLGVASLFGLTRLSEALGSVTQFIRGRLLVFFPGQREGSNYRLLDARDGWNYLAIPISATEER